MRRASVMPSPASGASVPSPPVPWRRACLAVCLLAPALLFAAPDRPPEESDTTGPSRRQLLETTIEELRRVFDAIADNLAEQDRAWPTRETDQSNEYGPPYDVRILQRAHRKLENRKKLLLEHLEARAPGNLDLLLRTLASAERRALVDAVVPLAVELDRTDPRVFATLKALARRHVPCPLSVIAGLAALERREASLFLFELGRAEGNPAMLRAAGNTGDRVVLERIIRMASEADRESRELGLRTIARLDPPRRFPESLQRLLFWSIDTAATPELRGALIVYLGHSSNGATLEYLKRTYERTDDEDIRVVIAGVLGNLGPDAGDFLLEELLRPENGLSVRRACIRSLGAARYTEASRPLIEFLADGHLKRDATSALERISGQRLGSGRAAWLRWWSAQPEEPPRE